MRNFIIFFHQTQWEVFFQIKFHPGWNSTRFIPGWNSRVNRNFFIPGRVSSCDEISSRVHVNALSKTTVSLRYQLKLLCDVLSWSVSLKYQLIRRYDVSNWSVLFTHQWDVTKMSQKGPTNWRTSCDVIMTSQHGDIQISL